jgi:hypothetical protein
MIDRIDQWLLTRVWQRLVNLLGQPKRWLMQACIPPAALAFAVALWPIASGPWTFLAFIVVLALYWLPCLAVWLATLSDDLMAVVAAGENAAANRMLALTACVACAMIAGAGGLGLAPLSFATMAFGELLHVAARSFAACQDPPPPRRRDSLVPGAT